MDTVQTTDAIQHPARAPVRALLPHGVELHFTDQGVGPPVILLHGGMGDAGSWTHQLPTLTARHRTITYSRRRSSPNRNPYIEATHRIEHDVDDLLALQHVLHTGPVHLVGTSYGALVALAFALRHPREVLSMVLAEPPLHRWACSTQSGRELYEAFIDQVWHPAAAEFAVGAERRAIQLLTDGIWGRAVFESLPDDRIDAAMRNADAMKAVALSPDPFPDLDRRSVERLQMPMLLIQGEHASPLHRHVMDELANVAHGATRVEIRKAGHGSPAENPAQFNAAVLSFLDSINAR